MDVSPPCPRLRPPPGRTLEQPNRKSQSQAQPGLRLLDERYSKGSARSGWEPRNLRPRRTPPRSRHRLLGGPSVPTPPPAATFPKTDTLPARARGGARGLPRRVPWRPRHPPQDQRAKGRPKTPAHGACCAPPTTAHTAQPQRGRRDTNAHQAATQGRDRGAHPAPCISGITQGTDAFENFRSACHFPRVTQD